jgi:uncharacterized coiled-coil DUF342 family protein
MIYKSNQLPNLVAKMVNPKDEIKKQSSNIREGTENTLGQQKQQVANTTSTISETTNNINENINQYQESNREILDDIIDTVHVFPTLTESIKLVATSFKQNIEKLTCCAQ